MSISLALVIRALQATARCVVVCILRLLNELLLIASLLKLVHYSMSTVAQILVFLPLTLATLGHSAFLSLSLLLTIHSMIHSTMNILLPGLQPSLPFLQVYGLSSALKPEQGYSFAIGIYLNLGPVTACLPSIDIQPLHCSLGCAAVRCVNMGGDTPLWRATLHWL